MVRIVRPQFDQVQSQVAPGPLQPLDASPAAYGAGLAVGGRQLGVAALRVAAQERQKVDQLAVTQAAAAGEKWVTDNIYGPGGLNELNGRAAMERGSTIMADYQKAMGAIRGGLSGAQVGMFDQGYAVEAQTRVDRIVQQKIGAARLQYDDETTAAATAKFTDSAATAAAEGAISVREGVLDDSATQQILEKVVANRVLWHQRNGGRVEGDKRLAAIADVRKDVSAFHVGILRSVLAKPNGSEVAAAYLKAHGKEIEPGERADIEKALAHNTEIDEADRLARKAFQDIYLVKTGEEGEVEADRYQRAYESLADKPKAREALSKLRDEHMQTQGQREAQVAESLFNMIDEGEDDASILRKLGAANLGEEAETAVEEALADRPKGADPAKQWTRFRELDDMFTSDDPAEREKFRGLNIALEKKRLNKDQYARIEAMHRDANSGGAAKLLDGERSKTEVLKSWAEKLYPFSVGYYATEEDKEAADDFQREMDHLVEQAKAEKGRDLTNREIDDIIEPLFARITFDSWLGRSEGYVAQMADVDYSAGDIPKHFLMDAYVLAAEESPGAVPTAERIEQIARELVEIDRGGR